MYILLLFVVLVLIKHKYARMYIFLLFVVLVNIYRQVRHNVHYASLCGTCAY